MSQRLDELAVLPSVISKLISMSPQEERFSETLMDLCRSDPTLALRLLRLGSGATGPAARPESLAEAFVRVGADRLADLLLSLSVVQVFVPRTRGQRNLWIHSIQVATAARRLAYLYPDVAVAPDHAYLAGLLHDIGRFLLFEHSPSELGRIDEANAENPKQLVEAELRVCGFDHAELGWHICEHWKVAERVTAMVRYHHRYREAIAVVPPEVTSLVRLVQQADCLSFGLLQVPALARRPDRAEHLERLFRLVGTPVVPVSVCRDTLAEIERQSRLAASVVDLAVDLQA